MSERADRTAFGVLARRVQRSGIGGGEGAGTMVNPDVIALIDKQSANVADDPIVRQRLGVSLERFQFGVEAHHPAMRVRALDGDAEDFPGEDVAGPFGPADVRGARRGDRAVVALRPAQAETEITFGSTSNTAFNLAHYVATEKKYYEAEDLKVDTIIAGAAVDLRASNIKLWDRGARIAREMRLRPERRSLVRGMVYPVPDPELPFLGVHLTKRIDGEVLVGPSALLAGARDAYALRRLVPGDLAATLSWPASTAGTYPVANYQVYQAGAGGRLAYSDTGSGIRTGWR